MQIAGLLVATVVTKLIVPVLNVVAVDRLTCPRATHRALSLFQEPHMKLKVGDTFPIQKFHSVAGDTVTIPDPTRLVHVQFRRWVGCPICNIHIGQLIKRIDEITAAGVREVLFFHSHAEDMKAIQGDVPFDLVADPTKEHYKRVGAETSLWYWLSLKTIRAALNGVVKGKVTLNTFKMTNGPFGLPADFLVDQSGRIVAVMYGRSAYDQWSVDELLTLARTVRCVVEPVTPPTPGGRPYP